MTYEKAYSLLVMNSPYTACDGCEEDCEVCEYNEAIDIALFAIEKQIPKKPIHPFEPDRYNLYVCPNQKHGTSLMIGQPFCEFCGQAIDWSDSSSEKPNN